MRANRNPKPAFDDRGSGRRGDRNDLCAGTARNECGAGKGTHVSTARTSLGPILVASRGRTLCVFGKDKQGKSACSGPCAANWPPLVTSSKPRGTNGARASPIGTTKRADGRLQVTYNHHPLYTFVKDTKKGQTNGEGLHVFGGEWDVVSPEGNKVDKNSSSSSGGGYSGP